MDIDKNLEHMMRHTRPEDHKRIMQILQAKRDDPVVQLSLAMFRDSIVFKDMVQSMVLDFKCEVRDLKKQISSLTDDLEELSDAKQKLNEGEKK